MFTTEMPSFRKLRSTYKRDLKSVYLYFKFLFYLKKCYFLNQSVADLFHLTVEKYKNEICFIFQDEEWTFKKVDEFSNRIANSFLLQGYKKGDEVALMMENCPEYVCIWLGLSKIGVITALINTNLREDALGHSINILNIKAIIHGANFTDVLQNAKPFLKCENSLEYYSYLGREKSENIPSSFHTKPLDLLINEASLDRPNIGKNKPNFGDKLMYIYTSGTTGLPKAAVIRNSRYMWISVAAKFPLRLRDFEICYNTLPLYHTSGNVIIMGVVLMFGGTMILRKKFSASNFWKDAVKYKVTVAQYIGEICRYLLNQPKIPEETQHCVRLMCGNGLKPHLWTEFQERFKIKTIIELYGSTEGNANIANIFGKPGAVGFFPSLLDKIFPVYLMKINPETGELLRNKRGLCIRCKPGEHGEIVGKILRSHPLNSFDGYANKSESSKKIIRNCFKMGDTAFASGDILVMDEDGYLYFVDRTGDTFRWKGENVSTGEVENIVSKALNHITCVVYGVEIPKVEGRAGMAAIQMKVEDVDLSELYSKLTKKLPSYAVPIFIRVSGNIESTGTYKLRKVTLQKEGFNLELIPDPIFFINHKQKNYVRVTQDLYSDIIEGRVRL